jgi:predicted Zn-dependent protease
MADNPDFPGQDKPHPAPASHGDLPADFFDDAADPSPVRVASAQPAAGPKPPTPIGMPVEEPPPGAPRFPIVMGILMIGALMAAVFVSMQQAKEAPAASPTTAAAPAATPSASAASESPTPAPAANNGSLAGEVKELKGQVEGLSSALKALQGKLDDLPKPPPAPDLKTIQGKLDDLAKTVGGVAPLPEKVGKLDERVGAVDDNLKSLKTELTALRDELKKTGETAKPAATTAATDDTATAMTEGANLFKAGKYKEAGDIFKKLEAGSPKDARVYYYAALTNGLNTRDWQNETLKIAAKGAELEKAGVTKPADVDAAFADLPATLKPWLTFFRAKAK